MVEVDWRRVVSRLAELSSYHSDRAVARVESLALRQTHATVAAVLGGVRSALESGIVASPEPSYSSCRWPACTCFGPQALNECRASKKMREEVEE